MRKNFRRRKGSRSGDASETSLDVEQPESAPSVAFDTSWKKLPFLGPVELPTFTSPSGFVYRNNVLYPSNQDKVEVFQHHRELNLDGIHYDNSAVKIAGSQLADIEAHFWPDVYVMLHEMAQYRDGYKSTDSALTTWQAARYREEIILTLLINIRVLWTLYHCTLYNEGMKTMMTGFAGKYRRMSDLLDWSNRLIYPAEWGPFIDYWSTVFTPYPGGPVCYNLFSMKGVIHFAITGAGTLTAWANTNRPALELSADVSALLDDILILLMVVDRYTIDDAFMKKDFKLLTSLYKMMSFPTPHQGVKGMIVSPEMFIQQFKQGAFQFVDNKGIGTNTFVCNNDIEGAVDALIDCPDYGFPYSDLWFKGMQGTYAHDLQDSATKGYCANTEKIAQLGVVRLADMSATTASPLGHCERLYTPEDGWYEPTMDLDFTDAAGLQAFFWSHPHVTAHPQHWVVIRSEEAEEDYRQPQDIIGKNGFQMPFDHIGIEFRKFLHMAYKIPHTQ